MSLILAGLVVAGTSGALVVGRWVARRLRVESAGDDAATAPPKEPQDAATGGKKDDAASGADPKPPPPADAVRSKQPRRVEGEQPHLSGFVCQLGDVLMRITGEEAWLAGAVVLSEEVPVAVLFVAPDAGHDRVVYVRAPPNGSLLWLEPLDPSAVLVGGEPPSSVEHDGIRFDRARRLPLRPRRIGVGAPDVGDAVVVAEYASAGSERLVVLKANSGLVAAYRGVELAPGAFEVIPSGASTLES